MQLTLADYVYEKRHVHPGLCQDGSPGWGDFILTTCPNQRAKNAGKGKGSSNFYDPRISCLRLGVKSGESSKKAQHFTKYFRTFK